MLYLIKIRRLAHKILEISSNAPLFVNYRNDKWPLYYRSFNILSIKDVPTKHSAITIKDAIDLLIRNGHAKKFPHHSAEELQNLSEDYKGLYLRYITTDEGVFAWRSNYYRDDWIFNVVLSKISLLQGALGITIIYVLSNLVGLLLGAKKEKKEPQIKVILIQQSSMPNNHQTHSDTTILLPFEKSASSDTTYFLIDTLKTKKAKPKR